MSDRRVDEYAAGLTAWRDEFAAPRAILLDTELTEAFKWLDRDAGRSDARR